MRLIYAGIALIFGSLGFADTITLKGGNVINGTYLGGTARQVRVDVGDSIQTIDVTDISRIEFGGNTPPPPVAVAPPRRESNVMRPDPTPPPPPPPAQAAMNGFTLPAGTNFVIRMIEGVDSERARVGQTFAASLDQPVMLNGLESELSSTPTSLAPGTDRKLSGRSPSKTTSMYGLS